MFASFILGCFFQCNEHYQTSSSLKEKRAFASIYSWGNICYHSRLFDRKINSYQFLLSLPFSEEKSGCCYGESKAVPLLSILLCFCLTQLYSTFLYTCLLVSLVYVHIRYSVVSFQYHKLKCHCRQKSETELGVSKS